MEKKLNVLCLVKKVNIPTWKKISKDWEKYFNISVTLDSADKIKKYLKTQTDILFFESDRPISLTTYKQFQKGSPRFANIQLVDKPSDKDVFTYKSFVDRIVYTKISHEYSLWSSMASLRRFWKNYSKPSTIVYRNIIADFVEQKFMIDGEIKELTVKEAQLLKFFLNNRGEIITKNEIFQNVWGYDTHDSTRTFDQMFFKLKAKIGKDYFKVKRNKGIIFE